MTIKDAAQVQIRRNRTIMRGLPEGSVTWKMLKKQNDELGQIGIPATLTEKSQKWYRVADILTQLAFGDGETYQALEAHSVYRGLIAQETNKIFELLT